MSPAQVQEQVKTKIARLAEHALLLDDIEEACEDAGEDRLAEIIRAEQAELSEWRRTIHQAYKRSFGG